MYHTLLQIKTLECSRSSQLYRPGIIDPPQQKAEVGILGRGSKGSIVGSGGDKQEWYRSI